VEDPTTTDHDHDIERAREHRNALRSRHTHALVRLMDQRADLRGVHPLADLVADSARWTA
jgi:hypothetical protein